MKRAAIAAGVLVLAAAAYWVVWPEVQEERLRRDIRAGVNQALDRRTSFDVRSAADFDWDRFFVFHAYEPEESINRSVGYAWQKDTPILQDEFTLLAFMADGKVVRSAMIDAQDADFSELAFGPAGKSGVTPRDARFRARTKGGRPVVDYLP